MNDERRVSPGRRLNDFASCPRFERHEISEDQIVEIAKKAVLLAKDEFYLEVGKSVTKKFIIVVGFLTTLFLGWLSAKGYIK